MKKKFYKVVNQMLEMLKQFSEIFKLLVVLYNSINPKMYSIYIDKKKVISYKKQ